MDERRSLPSVNRVVETIRADFPTLPHAVLVLCAREVIDAARDGSLGGRGKSAGEAAIVEQVRERASSFASALLRPVVNATGVLIHTNLGRVPLGTGALESIAAVASGYSNLEMNLDSGRRGSRHVHAGALLARACGAESGLVVNNNAAAVLLVLRALARDREVIVSRGELVEIGGGFRVPDVMAESGARLVEVGTTNRTRRADYERALTGATALVLKVHPSNYRMVGFVEAAGVGELGDLGPPVVVDAGSGLLDDTTPWLDRRPGWLRDELGVRQCLDAGAALVTFSGDKLLGGPQAGIVVGRADLVDTIARHPLARAVRADKMTLAALQSVAQAYLSGDGQAIPFWQMASVPLDVLRERAHAVAASGPGLKVVDTEAVAGGGSLPGLTIPSIGVAFEPDHTGGSSGAAAAMAVDRLRLEHGVIARLDAGAVVADLRTVAPGDDGRLAAALAAVAAPRP